MASNVTAAILSALFPGLGQFYKGHFWRGVVVLLLSWTVIVYLIGIVDAYLLDSGHVTVTVVNNQVVQ